MSMEKKAPAKRKEWIDAAYTEIRENPTDGFQKGKTYRFPTGDSPEGANCLKECQIEAFPPPGKKNYSIKLRRGAGHARVATTKKGVNGLYDMGANSGNGPSSVKVLSRGRWEVLGGMGHGRWKRIMV